MIIDSSLEGKYVSLRPVNEDDAKFIIDIRNNPLITKYLPPLNVTIDQQKQWINKQRSDSESYYFIMQNRKGKSSGTISVYDIHDGEGEFGRICSIGNPIANIEACILLFDYCFSEINLNKLHLWVYEDNTAVIHFDEELGFEWVDKGADQEDKNFLVGILKKESYLQNREIILKKYFK